MIPIRLMLTNYGPFRGEHVVQLSPTIYSVVASDEGDPERSNWIGKTWFLSAFRYALYGRHPGHTKDRMITDGENEGGVRLDLEGSVSIIRTKKRGSSEQLVLRCKGKPAAKQESAQKRIDELVGHDRMDFDASYWVKQKGANEMVVADPAARTNTIAGWMNLIPLQRASEMESKRLLAALELDRVKSSRIEQLTEMLESTGDANEVAVKIDELERSIATDEVKLERLNSRFEIVSKAERLDLLQEQLDETIEAGKALKSNMAGNSGSADLDEELNEIERELNEAIAEHAEKSREVTRIRGLVFGDGFDGICPVVSEKCPSAERISTKARKMNRELEAMNCECAKIEKTRSERLNEREQLRDEKRAWDANVVRLNSMRDQAKRLIAEIETLKSEVGDCDLDFSEVRTELRNMQAKIGIESGELAALTKQMESVDAWIQERRMLEQERESMVATIRTHREAMAVLGRNGAQREIASGYLSEIERGANDLLGSAGIDLSVKASWGREGTGLASHCQACGQPFPSSAKIKECTMCGAARGPKIVEKLELEVSRDSSGAAEDVAGLAMQLSAAAWLRIKRQSAWSSVFIDEPFAACDARVGAQLASQLRAMLGGRYSFRQAFIVSHSASLTESMPGRIMIHRRSDGMLTITVV